MAINLEWNNRHEARAFPLDDSASGLSDAGELLPSDILSGAKILFPKGAGLYAYISALSVTNNVVTVIVSATSSPGAAGDPILTITEGLPVQPGLPYRMESQYFGAGGWITFGHGIATPWRGLFSLPTQSLLAPLAARSFRSPGVSSIGKYGFAGLRGYVQLRAGNDIDLRYGCYVLDHLPDGDPNNCEFGRYAIGVSIDTSGDNPGAKLKKYAGKCGARPESGTCGDPSPVEKIGPVGPDCCGNITVAVRGDVMLHEVTSQIGFDELGDPVFDDQIHGVLLSSSIRLADICQKHSTLPDEDGNLPSQPQSLCDPE